MHGPNNANDNAKTDAERATRPYDKHERLDGPCVAISCVRSVRAEGAIPYFIFPPMELMTVPWIRHIHKLSKNNLCSVDRKQNLCQIRNQLSIDLTKNEIFLIYAIYGIEKFCLMLNR